MVLYSTCIQTKSQRSWYFAVLQHTFVHVLVQCQQLASTDQWTQQFLISLNAYIVIVIPTYDSRSMKENVIDFLTFLVSERPTHLDYTVFHLRQS